MCDEKLAKEKLNSQIAHFTYYVCDNFNFMECDTTDISLSAHIVFLRLKILNDEFKLMPITVP